jgi:hypothetical protein
MRAFYLRAFSTATFTLILGTLNPGRCDQMHLFGFETGQSISYQGGTAALQGDLGEWAGYTINGSNTDILLPDSSGVSFTTGGFVGYSGPDWFFAPGGSFSFHGEMLSGNNIVVPPTALITGSFNGTGTLSYIPQTLSYSFNDTFLATIDPGLATALGIAAGNYNGTLSVGTGGSFYPTPGGPVSCGSCIDTVTIDLTSAPGPAPVPEQSSWMLLATAVLICGVAVQIGFSRRRPVTSPARS